MDARNQLSWLRGALRSLRSARVHACAVFSVSSLSLAACCTDCMRLSELGAVSYSGPATMSGTKSRTSAQGSSAGASTQKKTPAENALYAPRIPPTGAEAVGSAFYVNPKGQLLTTWEEIRDCHKVAVLVDYEYRDATVVASNPLSGLAVLRVPISSQIYAVLRTSAVADGEGISAFAHPIQDGISLPLEGATGTVRASTSPDGIEGVIQHSAILDGGGTGGPMVDKRGDVVGIIVHPLSKKWPTDVGYGISTAAILKFTAAARIEIWERPAAGSSNAAIAESSASNADGYTVPVICFR